MPVTAVTFIVGWLAIAGVPPFAGFWSKDEILLFALAKSPVLYVVGLVTALLTAYYMTRQVMMVFFGEAHWSDAAAEHGAHGEFKPHESPAIMLFPLVVLAVAVDRRRAHPAARVRGSRTPSVTASSSGSSRWSSSARRNIAGTWADDHKTLLMVIATVVALAGIGLAWLVYQRHRIKAVEPKVLANGWYYDQAVTDFMGGPGREGLRGGGLVRRQRRRRRCQRHRPSRARRRPASCARARAATCAPTPRSSASASSCCSPGSSSSGGSCDGRRRLPDPHRARARAGGRRRWPSRSLSSRRPELVKLVGLLSQRAHRCPQHLAARRVRHGRRRLPVRHEHRWIEEWGISWHLGVDGISLLLVVLTGILFPLAIVGADPHHDEKPYLAWLLLLEAGVMGSFLSLDLFVFFIFFEIVLVPMYFLIGGWGYERPVYAARSSSCSRCSARRSCSSASSPPCSSPGSNGVDQLTFDLTVIAERADFAATTGRWLFFAFAIAFAVKVPIFPLHTWLPDAHTQAPDRRFGDPRRRDAEARHVRPAALRACTCSPRRRAGPGRCS